METFDVIASAKLKSIHHNVAIAKLLPCLNLSNFTTRSSHGKSHMVHKNFEFCRVLGFGDGMGLDERVV